MLNHTWGITKREDSERQGLEKREIEVSDKGWTCKGDKKRLARIVDETLENILSQKSTKVAEVLKCVKYYKITAKL